MRYFEATGSLSIQVADENFGSFALFAAWSHANELVWEEWARAEIMSLPRMRVPDGAYWGLVEGICLRRYRSAEGQASDS